MRKSKTELTTDASKSTDASPSKGSEAPGILKKAKDPSSTAGISLAKPKFGEAKVIAPGSVKNRSKSKKRSPSPLAYTDPRQQIYEAKYEKYLANSRVKKDLDKKRQSLKKENFDIYTKGP
jgi:hypothetical protein